MIIYQDILEILRPEVLPGCASTGWCPLEQSCVWTFKNSLSQGRSNKISGNL